MGRPYNVPLLPAKIGYKRAPKIRKTNQRPRAQAAGPQWFTTSKIFQEILGVRRPAGALLLNLVKQPSDYKAAAGRRTPRLNLE
jgi:hypothetical protein